MIDQPARTHKVLERQDSFSWNLNMWEEWRKHVLAALEIVAKDPDEGVREEAATAIARMGEPSDLAAALEVIRDPESPAPISIIFSLGPLEEPVVAQAVLDAYCRSSDLKTAFAQGGGHKMFYAEGGIQVLIQALEGDDRERRRIAADFLSDIAPPQAEAALLRALDQDPGLSSNIHRALGKIGTPAAVDTLIRSTYHENPFTRGSAIAAIHESGDRRAIPRLFELQGDPNGWVQTRAKEALGHLREPPKDPELRVKSYLQSLGESDTVEELVQRLEEGCDMRGSDRLVQQDAEGIIYQLANHPDPAAVPALINAFDSARENQQQAEFDLEDADVDEKDHPQSCIDMEEDLCLKIVEALVDRDDIRAADFLAGVAHAGRDSGLGRIAVKGLDNFEGPEVFARLKAVQSRFEDNMLKLGVGVTLARRGHRESLELMLAALNNEEADDLKRAAWALGQVFRDEPILGDAEALERLQTALPTPREMTEFEREWKERERAHKERNSGPLFFAPPEEFVARAQAHLDEHGVPLLEYRSEDYRHALEVEVHGGGPYEFDEPSAFDPEEEPDTTNVAAITLMGHGTETIFKHPTTGAELGKLTHRYNDGMLSGCVLWAAGVDTLMAISCLQYFLDEEKESVRITIS